MVNQDGQLSMQDVIDIFPYGNIHGFPPREENTTDGTSIQSLWEEAMEHLENFFQTRSSTEQLQLARTNLSMLLQTTTKPSQLSDLQQGLLNRLLTEIESLMNQEL